MRLRILLAAMGANAFQPFFKKKNSHPLQRLFVTVTINCDFGFLRSTQRPYNVNANVGTGTDVELLPP